MKGLQYGIDIICAIVYIVTIFGFMFVYLCDVVGNISRLVAFIFEWEQKEKNETHQQQQNNEDIWEV